MTGDHCFSEHSAQRVLGRRQVDSEDRILEGQLGRHRVHRLAEDLPHQILDRLHRLREVLLELRGAGVARTDEHPLQGVVEPRQRLVCIALVGTAHPDGGDLHEVERLERPLVDLARPRIRALPQSHSPCRE
ncbi:hypothetical protein GCM10025862_04080 [Arsenicicoccus piscis]|uniref:Uncharacterized protein n=1 Tax=Arsenicicoccus piscis TaxID=673954 RepID=A0ABQ6HJ18_9MICO|nr:hypothetical protein GCM10025862_04080 [Arsenicicoccus piscis]